MSDTSPDARRIQIEVHRRLSGPERLRIALEMSLFARRLSIARLRRQHPDWSQAALEREVLRYAFLPGELPEPLR